MKEKKVILYVRVSTMQQNFSMQKEELLAWAKRNDKKSILVISDQFTGKTMARPGWSKVESLIDSGSVECIVIWKLDRLGRTVSGLSRLFQELIDRNIPLISIKDNIDLSTSNGRLIANILASVAEFETELRADRVKAGQQRALENGKRWGGSKRGWHYKVTPEHLEIIPRLKSEGKRISEIIRLTGLTRPTIMKIIGKEKCNG